MNSNHRYPDRRRAQSDAFGNVIRILGNCHRCDININERIEVGLTRGGDSRGIFTALIYHQRCDIRTMLSDEHCLAGTLLAHEQTSEQVGLGLFYNILHLNLCLNE